MSDTPALSPALLVAAANAFVGLVVEDRKGDLADDGTALLYRWGYWSHFDHATERSSWPLIETLTADELATVAMTKYVLRDAPAAGDIFLQRSPVSKRYIRAGVVAAVCGSGQYDRNVVYHDTVTIEASTDTAAPLDGRRTLRVSRRFLPSRGDRFIRWAEVDDFVDASGRTVLGYILARVIPGGDGGGQTPNEGIEQREAA